MLLLLISLTAVQVSSLSLSAAVARVQTRYLHPVMVSKGPRDLPEEEQDRLWKQEQQRELQRRQEANDGNEFEEDERDKLVEMSSDLGRVPDLSPISGPPVPQPDVNTSDPRPLFVAVRTFKPRQMPSDTLTEQYVEWVSEASDLVCRAGYLLSADSFDGFEEADGTVLSDEDLDELDEQDMDLEPEMQDLGVQFVSGNVIVARADEIEPLDEWMQEDPISEAGGYEQTSLHRWLRSDDVKLNHPQAQGPSYLIHCLDKNGQGDLRARTREAHLQWLMESGRVHLGGALQSHAGEVAGNVGTLLVVNGEDLHEVRQWAAEDPYTQAGLFARVNIAPMLEYNVQDLLEL